MRRVPDKAGKLHDDRVVQPELLAQFRAFLRARLDADHLVDGIADETEQRESDQRDHDHDKHGLNDATQHESEHV